MKEIVLGQRNDPVLDGISDGVNTISYPEQRRPYPERFRGISAHSSITEAGQMGDFVRELDLTDMPAQEREILHWAHMNRDRLPPVRFDCGRDDSLFEANATLHRQLGTLGIPHTYETFSSGHEWPYWRQHIASTLRFFHSLL